MDLNIQIFNFLYSFAHRSVALDSVIIFIASDFALISAFALFYFLYKHKDRRRGVKEVSVVVISAFIAWAIAHLLKDFYHVPRPDAAAGITSIIDYGRDIYSFPSGHATFFSALAISIYFYHKKLGYFFAVCALVIGIARIMAGIHYPADITTGYLLGTLIALLAYMFIQKKALSGDK